MTIRLLIADDHDLVREGIRRILRDDADITVVGEAVDGSHAVALAASLRPDIVLMDIRMPVLDGIEATRVMAAGGPHPAILILSAHDDDAYVFDALEAGAAGYLLKSEPAAELSAAIRAVYSGASVLSPAVATKVLARLGGHATPAPAPPAPLSASEVEMLRLAAAGMENRAIGERLGVGTRFVQRCMALIFEKLEVSSRTHAVVVAMKHGWLRIEDV